MSAPTVPPDRMNPAKTQTMTTMLPAITTMGSGLAEGGWGAPPHARRHCGAARPDGVRHDSLECGRRRLDDDSWDRVFAVFGDSAVVVRRPVERRRHFEC